MCVDPGTLERDVVRADVAFFEYSDFEAQFFSDFAGLNVNGAAVAEEQHGVNLLFEHKLLKKRGPFLGFSQEGGGVVREENPVASVEIDLTDLRPSPGEVFRKAPEKRANGPLEQNNSFVFKLSEAV